MPRRYPCGKGSSTPSPGQFPALTRERRKRRQSGLRITSGTDTGARFVIRDGKLEMRRILVRRMR